MGQETETNGMLSKSKPADEADFTESTWFETTFGDAISKSESMRPEAGDEWTCFLCGHVDEMFAFESHMCDACFSKQIHRWAVETERVLIDWLQCDEDGCPCSKGDQVN